MLSTIILNFHIIKASPSDQIGQGPAEVYRRDPGIQFNHLHQLKSPIFITKLMLKIFGNFVSTILNSYNLGNDSIFHNFKYFSIHSNANLRFDYVYKKYK